MSTLTENPFYNSLLNAILTPAENRVRKIQRIFCFFSSYTFYLRQLQVFLVVFQVKDLEQYRQNYKVLYQFVAGYNVGDSIIEKSQN